MKQQFFQAILVILLPIALYAQPSVTADEEDLPKDYLSASFHAGRRAALREIMPDNSVAVIFAYPTRNFSNDVEYLFHQNPDMYYFSGYKEPHSMLLIFKNEQTDSAGKKFSELLFVQRKDPMAEQWTGKRMGTEGAQKKLGIRMALNASAFKNFNIDFAGFDKILFDGFPIDVRNNIRDSADLFDLMKAFKEKAAIPEDYSKEKKFDRREYRALTAKLREIKTDEEMVLLRKAVEISCQGQNEVMKAVHPNMSELEIQGLHEFIHKKYGAENVGYGSIIGAGENGCTLHYEVNSKTKIGNALLLMDVGAEYHGYTADVTRTVPAKGKFSDNEKAIYQLVYDAQEAAFRLLKNGCTWSAIDSVARETIRTGLIKLGIAKNAEDADRYYPHGLGHHIGMDVHDRGTYADLKKGMVITIEPGIYIPSNSPCDKKWWGIAVRIEDDALITQNGYELLSHFAPRKIEEIESMIAKQSALDDLKLPPLKSGEKRGF
ncbi:MAG: aminopeptidase P N-terminal domain-containing protein [Chitinophagaceae bacterium]